MNKQQWIVQQKLKNINWREFNKLNEFEKKFILHDIRDNNKTTDDEIIKLCVMIKIA